MSINGLINRKCTIKRRSGSGERDAHGNEAASPIEIATVWELQQVRRGESELGEVGETHWKAFFLPSTDVRGGDAVVDGEGAGTFEVAGPPWRVRSPFTKRESHIEATVRRTSGADDETGS